MIKILTHFTPVPSFVFFIVNFRGAFHSVLSYLAELRQRFHFPRNVYCLNFLYEFPSAICNVVSSL